MTDKPDNARLNASNDRFNLRVTKKRAAQELPAEWLPIIGAEAQQARAYHMRYADRDDLAARRVWDGYLGEYGGAAASSLSDGQIKAQAKAYASEADDLDIGRLTQRGPWGEYARLLDFCEKREVTAPHVRLLLRGMSSRVCCPYWWRRALRKMVAQKSERGHMAMGLVSLPNRQPYASNQAVFRRIAQNERNQIALESITMENEDGYTQTLAQLAAVSTSCKSIRRGELMTRIRGCEELADELGHLGLFCTMTTPSRFHSTLRNGRRNPKFDGSTPRQAQDWLCDQWEKARSKLDRCGVKVYGFRVAEPHHDGTPHWHMLIWAKDEWSVKMFKYIVHQYWIGEELRACTRELKAQNLTAATRREFNAADKYRTQFKDMEAGGAAGYIAKYIAKNIDDHAIDSHLDDYAESEIGPDLIGDLEIKPCQRVEAWASTWGIRQFQPLGQPPVSVWRELRRVAESTAKAAGLKGTIHRAWLACQKQGGERASWARYVKAQGGLMNGRKCHIKMRHDRREVLGMYGRDMRNVPVGVALNCPGSRTVWSERKLWRMVEAVPVSVPVPALECAFSKRSAPARTRVNNCTPVVEAVRLESLDSPEKRAAMAKQEADFYQEFPYARSLPHVNGLKAYFDEDRE